MEIVAHRRNSISELRDTPTRLGVEVDVRTQGDALIVVHDPFQSGELFDDWIEGYAHGLLILNTKEEGLEERLLAIMADRGITRFFFLDQSMPFLIKMARSGERRCAVRVSEYESVETALALAPMIDWVWVDCFTRFPLTADDSARLTGAGLKLCVVSPELQGRTDDREIPALRHQLAELRLVIDAVCTKRPELWA